MQIEGIGPQWAVFARLNGRRIAAVKVLRDATGCSFKDAADQTRTGFVLVRAIPTRAAARDLARRFREVGVSTTVCGGRRRPSHG